MRDFKKYQLRFFLYVFIFIAVFGVFVFILTRNIRRQFITSTPTPPANNNSGDISIHDFQNLLANKCKSISPMVPATLVIDPAELPITVNFSIENKYYCFSDWKSAPNMSVMFYDADQGYLLFDKDWSYDTGLLQGDATTEYRPNSKGILVRKVDNIDQYIMLESRNARFSADDNTWLELYSVKKDKKSELKIMTHTTLISGANKEFAGVLLRGYIETYNNTPEEYATLMNKIITELLNPIKAPEKSIMDGQVEKLKKIEFK